MVLDIVETIESPIGIEFLFPKICRTPKYTLLTVPNIHLQHVEIKTMHKNKSTKSAID